MILNASLLRRCKSHFSVKNNFMRAKKTPNKWKETDAKSRLVVQLDLPLNKDLIWHDCMFAKRRTSFKRKLSISALEDSSEKGTKRPVTALKNLRGVSWLRDGRRCALNNCCLGDSPVTVLQHAGEEKAAVKKNAHDI